MGSGDSELPVSWQGWVRAARGGSELEDRNMGISDTHRAFREGLERLFYRSVTVKHEARSYVHLSQVGDADLQKAGSMETNFFLIFCQLCLVFRQI